MGHHAKDSLATSMPAYFADPYSPWPRPSKENTNRLYREYRPKGTVIPGHQPYLTTIAEETNIRPCRRLGFPTPTESLARLLASEPHVASMSRHHLVVLCDSGVLTTPITAASRAILRQQRAPPQHEPMRPLFPIHHPESTQDRKVHTFHTLANTEFRVVRIFNSRHPDRTVGTRPHNGTLPCNCSGHTLPLRKVPINLLRRGHTPKNTNGLLEKPSRSLW